MINMEEFGILGDIEKGIYILEKIPYDCLDCCPIFDNASHSCSDSKLDIVENGIDNLMMNCPIKKFPKKQSVKTFNKYVPDNIKKDMTSYFRGYNDCLDDIAGINQDNNE